MPYTHIFSKFNKVQESNYLVVKKPIVLKSSVNTSTGLLSVAVIKMPARIGWEKEEFILFFFGLSFYITIHH